MNCLLSGLLIKLFPKQQRALELVKKGEERLSLYWNPKDQLCQGGCDDRTIDPPLDKNKDLQEIIRTYFDPAINTCPNLQLPYIIRAKALAELSLFQEAIQDSRIAHGLNLYNRRGIATEKLVVWRQRMHESHLHMLATCAISALIHSNDNIEESDVHNAVKEAAQDLRKEMELGRCYDTSSFYPESSKHLQPSDTGIDSGDIECQLCLGTIIRPTTSPCGHTWCQKCLLSSLDHSFDCPYCRSSLPSISYFMKRSPDASIQTLLTIIGENEMILDEKEEYELGGKKIPLLICSLIFPNAVEGFHIFEPRYRAMIKRCLDGNSEFGVVLPNPNNQSANSVCVEYGTVVKIKRHEQLTRGDYVPTEEGDLPRYMLETQGVYRFKINHLEQSTAGYYTATVDRIEDVEPEDANPDWDPSELEALCLKAREFVSILISSVPPTARLHFERKYGKIPESPSELSYWLAGCLPLNPYTLSTLLPISSVVERMKIICNWIDQSRSK
ncbi:hypothetical protein HDV06_004275 [Boothiomyces sp. JEL0866]|nr:hypothetical protein HDV06_004275 [Boothiomyces sp. JEL0866]